MTSVICMDETQIEENTIKVAKITVHPKYGKNYSLVISVSRKFG